MRFLLHSQRTDRLPTLFQQIGLNTGNRTTVITGIGTDTGLELTPEIEEQLVRSALEN